MAASIRHMIAFGPRAGKKVRTLKATAFGHEGEQAQLVKQRCAKIHGFSLHADVRIKANRRDKLEKLVRYTARGAFSLKRLPDCIQPVPPSCKHLYRATAVKLYHPVA